MPPHTFGVLSPASLATSTKVTGMGESPCGMGAAFSKGVPFHRQRGVVRASRIPDPKSIPEEPSQLRRENFMQYLRRPGAPFAFPPFSSVCQNSLAVQLVVSAVHDCRNP